MTESHEEFEDRLRRVLDQAARQLPVAPVTWQESSSAARRSPRRVSLRLSNAGLALGLAIPVTVAVMAVALLGHQRPVSHDRRPSGTLTSETAGSVPTLAQLKANFAVLRRPQTAADRFAAQYICHACGARVLPGLTRLARTLPDGTKVFLNVWHLQIAEQGQPAGSYALHEDVIGGTPILDPGSLKDTTFGAGSDYTVMPSTIEIQGRAPVWTGIVPDGVTSVRWTFTCPPAPRNHCRQRGLLAPVTADASVIGNIAGAQVAGTGGSGAVIRAPTQADWYTGRGYQVASFPRSDRLTRAPFFAPQLIGRPPSTTRPPRLELTGAGLRSVPFGATPRRLERLLAPVLGRPDGGYRAVSDCGVDHELSWPILLNPITGQIQSAEQLELFFAHDRFVGYQYGGNPLSARNAGAHLRIGARTARGLAVGDTLTVGQRLYGHDFTISSAQGGTWRARTSDGPLSGYAFGNPKHGDVSPRSLVSSIDAGDVGCPALSP